jgi:Nitrate reductase gamma subunit
LTALVFDLSGLALLAGLVKAALYWKREKGLPANAPRRDWPALGLLLAITVTGFVLEGLRIALTGTPEGSQWAFAGYALSRICNLMSPAQLADIYGWGWYLHAVVTAATVAYIPFSQLRHIFTSPIFMLVQTLRGRH